MKFLIEKEKLQYAIQKVQRVISTRSPLPVLTGILFECSEGLLKLTATDMEMSIMCLVPAEVSSPGNLVIPAKYISEFAKRLPNVPIEFDTIGDAKLATIRYGMSEFNINGYSAADFPLLHFFKEEFSFLVSSEELKDIIRKVIYASSNDDSRPIFTGVLLEIEGQEAALVATDTFRLAMKKFKIDVPSPSLINVVVPGKTLNEVVRVMGSNDKVRITLSKNQIMFKTEDMVIISRLITGRFPSYRQVIPDHFDCLIRSSIQELLESAERASLLAGERNSLIVFQSQKNGIVISVRSENGWIREDIPATVEGENYDILFNVHYLCDVLRSCDGDEILVKLTGTYSPAVIAPPEEDGYLSVIVPARTSRE